MPGQLPLQRSPRLDVEGAVDRLVGDLHRLIVGVADPQPARDLLGGVVLSEALLDHPTKLGAELELCRPRPDASHSRQVVAHAAPGKAEPPPDLAIAQPLRSQLPDRLLRHLAQTEAPWHHRTSLVGQQVADSPGWCGGGLRPPPEASAPPAANDTLAFRPKQASRATEPRRSLV